MKALVEKDISMKKQEKEMRKVPHFLCTFIKGTRGNSRELEGTQGKRSYKKWKGNELKGTHSNLGFFKGSARRSKEGKNSQREKNSGKGEKR